MFQDPTKSLLLWGSSGTGKTLALVAALKRKVACYRRRKIPYRVLVCCYGSPVNNCKQLLCDFKSKYGLQSTLENGETDPIVLGQLKDLKSNRKLLVCLFIEIFFYLSFQSMVFMSTLEMLQKP